MSVLLVSMVHGGSTGVAQHKYYYLPWVPKVTKISKTCIDCEPNIISGIAQLQSISVGMTNRGRMIQTQ